MVHLHHADPGAGSQFLPRHAGSQSRPARGSVGAGTFSVSAASGCVRPGRACGQPCLVLPVGHRWGTCTLPHPPVGRQEFLAHAARGGFLGSQYAACQTSAATPCRGQSVGQNNVR